MLLAGFQKNSFIDYPGKIAGVIYTTGCNFICPYCHNAPLARGEYPLRIRLSEILSFLKSRRGLLEGVTITGGEPTLHSGLMELCRRVKLLGYPVKLDTNGSRPEVLRALFERQLVDYVAMDIKAPLDQYAPFCRQPHIADELATSIGLIQNAAPDYEFRTTCTAPFIDAAAVETIAASIRGARLLVLQRFNRRAQYLDPLFDRSHDPAIPLDDMQRFRALAAPFVARCVLR